MPYYSAALVLVLHTYFWGTGLALLTLPRVWRRYWWAFAPCFGYALQSAVVWFGVHADFAGTDSYARASEALPLALLAAALFLRGRSFCKGARALPTIVALMALPAWLWLSPMAAAAPFLTSTSLGSCDHADYAAGARVFQEFAQSDRIGLLGQSEVTSVGSSQTFVDFWLRLNHFTPSALIAHHCSILGLKPHEIISLNGAVLALLNLPLLLLLARVTIGLRGLPLLLLALLYALIPMNSYAIHQGFLGQLYAAHGIMALNLLVFGALRLGRLGVSVWGFFPLALAALWLLAGSYNFILLVALAPGGARLLADAVLRRRVRLHARILGMLFAALILCALLFLGRFDGLFERMSLFKKSNFGWAVPVLTPEAWLGLLGDIQLNPLPVYPRSVALAAVAGLWLTGLVSLWRRRRRAQALAALSLVLPVACGWGLLVWETRVRANASYDAYKIISVFLPCLLTGLCCWLAALQRGRRRWQFDATIILLALLGANLWMALQFQRQMKTPWLRVDDTLAKLATVEADRTVTSVNLLVERMWDRLWASSLLLKKPQYFSQSTYEGRRPTKLEGLWSLADIPPGTPVATGPRLRVLGGRYLLSQSDPSEQITLEYADGWYSWETAGDRRWRWSSGQGTLRVSNSSPLPLMASVRLKLSANRPRRLFLLVNGLLHMTVPVSQAHEWVDFGQIELPPTVSTLVLWSQEAPTKPDGGDRRSLSFAVHDLSIRDSSRTVLPPAVGGRPDLVASGGPSKLEWGPGWYEEESSGNRKWRWSSGEAALELTNPLPMPVTAKLGLEIQSATGAIPLVLTLNDQPLPEQTVALERRVASFGKVRLQPGPNRLKLFTSAPPMMPGGNDKRRLSFALYGLQISEPAAVASPVSLAGTPFAAVEGFDFGRDWYSLEKDEKEYWRWSSGDSTIVLTNSQSEAQTVRLKLRVGSSTNRDLQLMLDGRVLAALPITQAHDLLDFGKVTLPPGDTEFTLMSPDAAFVPGGGDKRKLSFALFEVVIER